MVFERIEYETAEPPPSVAGHNQPSAASTATAAVTTAEAPASAPTRAPVAAPATGAEEEAPVEALAREVTTDHPLLASPAAIGDQQAVTPAAAAAAAAGETAVAEKL